MKFFINRKGKIGSFHAMHDAINAALQASMDYEQYLTSIALRLPEETRSFALAPWYRDPKSHECPHDSWLQDLVISASPNLKGSQTVSLMLKLLGSFHDRVLTIEYTNVIRCKLEIDRTEHKRLGDWLADEFDVDNNGCVCHDIAWEHGETWQIVCGSVKFKGEVV